MKAIILFAICITGTLAVTSDVLGGITTENISQKVVLQPTVNETYVGGSGSTPFNSSLVQRNLDGEVAFYPRDGVVKEAGVAQERVGPTVVNNHAGVFEISPTGIKNNGTLPVEVGKDVNFTLNHGSLSVTKTGVSNYGTNLTYKAGPVTYNYSVPAVSIQYETIVKDLLHRVLSQG